jgi:hypothetical protein
LQRGVSQAATQMGLSIPRPEVEQMIMRAIQRAGPDATARSILGDLGRELAGRRTEDRMETALVGSSVWTQYNVLNIVDSGPRKDLICSAGHWTLPLRNCATQATGGSLLPRAS